MEISKCFLRPFSESFFKLFVYLKSVTSEIIYNSLEISTKFVYIKKYSFEMGKIRLNIYIGPNKENSSKMT